MRVQRRLILWSLVALLATAGALAAPVIYINTTCLPDAAPVSAGVTEDVTKDVTVDVTEDSHPRSRTLTTYPEWHIVHAYDDFAAVTDQALPHACGYARAVRD